MLRLKIENVTSQILASNSSSLFIDTCALLDFIRVPYRSGSALNYSALDNLIRKAPTNHIVTTALNLDEVNRNISNVKIELERFINKVKMQMKHVAEASHYVNAGFNLVYDEIDTFDIPQKFENKLNALINSMRIIEMDDSTYTVGAKRCAQKTAPSANGELNDSVIYCHFHKVWKDLRSSGYSNKIIFLTSNSRDFGTPSNIIDPIKSELLNCNVIFVDKLNWADNELI